MGKDGVVLPGTILTNLLAREFEKGDGSWYEPNMAQHEEGGKWGLGEIVKERRDAARITPIEVLMGLHKTPIVSRPVGRAYNCQMKVYEQLVAVATSCSMLAYLTINVSVHTRTHTYANIVIAR